MTPTLADIERSRATVDVRTAARAFGISPSDAYELINRGGFPAIMIRVGHRRRVLASSIIRILTDTDRRSA